MATAWNPNAKFWCKYCKLFVTDNKISRDNHERNSAHRRAMEQYISDIAAGERKKQQEASQARMTVRQIEAEAEKQYLFELQAQGMSEAEAVAKVAIAKHQSKTLIAATAAAASGKPAQTHARPPAPPKPAPQAPPSSRTSGDDEDGEVDLADTIGQAGTWQTVEVSVMPGLAAIPDLADDANDDATAGPDRKRSRQEMEAEVGDESVAGGIAEMEEQVSASAFKVVERTVSLAAAAGEVRNTVLGSAGRSSVKSEGGGGGGPVLKKRKVGGARANVRK
ncbi:hypothetical protein BC828DRAFT_404189 [Blastocladiella britannica]|nr:hypothetical protein BC828DRAFT_404189 [Blastocladiella britannica]